MVNFRKIFENSEKMFGDQIKLKTQYIYSMHKYLNLLLVLYLLMIIRVFTIVQ